VCLDTGFETFIPNNICETTDSRQGRNETLQEFADRCRALSQKICEVYDPLAQSIHCENAEQMLLGSGLTRVPGRQVRYTNPQTLEQALKIALSVQEAEKINERFYTCLTIWLRCNHISPSRNCREDCKPHCSSDATDVVIHTPGWHYKLHNAGKPTTMSARSMQTKAAFRCSECEGVGHFAIECPTRLNREVNFTTTPGRWNPSERF
jgi:hypothetical protein